MHPLAGGQRPLGQIVHHPADALLGLGGRVCPTDLSEHLLLADHGTVQTAGHREKMFDCSLAVADVGMLGELTHRHAGVLGQHLTDRGEATVKSINDRIDLDPVAGRQDHRLGHQGRLEHPLNQLVLVRLIGDELFENRNRGAAVGNPEHQDAHGTITWPAPSLLIPGGPKVLPTIVGAQRAGQIFSGLHRFVTSARSRGSSRSQ